MWTELVERGAEPWQVLSTLLGLLEMAKVGELRVAQLRPFANVEIIRGCWATANRLIKHSDADRIILIVL